MTNSRGLLRLFLFSITSFLIGLPAWSQTLTLQNVDSQDLKNAVGELSTDFMHTSVSGAASLGRIFGFEVGVVGASTKTPDLNSIAQRGDASASASSVYDAALIGALTVPFGITGEIGLLPEVGSQDFKFKTTSLALKWTPTDLFFDWPLDVAVKASLTTTELKFHETVSSVPTDFDFKDTQDSLVLLASKNFVVVEPYVGFGVMSANGKLSASGSGSVFDTSFTTSDSASASNSSSLWMVGSEFKLVFVKLGVEYMHAFSTSRISGKLSFYF